MSSGIVRIRAFQALGVLAVGAMLALGLPTTAMAAVPDPPSAGFTAQKCPGATHEDPEDGSATYVNLLEVRDEIPGDPRISRLEAYNMGAVVPLYDSYGGSPMDGNRDTPREDAFPPICTVRHTSAGPVTQWMYCTDLTDHTCADVDADGFAIFRGHDELVRDLPGATMPLGQQGNPDLTPLQKKQINYILRHDLPYVGVGSWNYGSDANDTTPETRWARQTLVWCITDYNYVDHHGVPNPTHTETCDLNFASVNWEALLAAEPDPGLVPELTMTPASLTGKSGETLRIRITTDVFAPAITLQSTGSVAVCPGEPATLVGTTLTITPADPTAAESVDLCVVLPVTGAIELRATVEPPPGGPYLGWAQANSGLVGDECQVYAMDLDVEEFELTQLATLSVIPALAPTGPTSPAGPLAAALLLFGAGVFVRVRRARRAGVR